MRPPMRILSVALLTAVTAAACVSIDFKEPISSYSAAMAASGSTLLEHYKQVNELNRTLYLQQVQIDPKKEILAVGSDGKPTGLFATLTPESMKARVDAIRLLTVYGERLAALAGADAPQRFNTGAQTLGQNLLKLDETFQSLQGAADPTANSYIGPIASVIGAIGEMYLDKKRDEAIRDAILTAKEPINKILELLDADMRGLVAPLLETGVDQRLTVAMTNYNNRIDCEPKRVKDGSCSPINEAQRLAALQAIEKLAEDYESVLASQPTEVVDAMRDSHAALVKYAESSHEPNDLASLVAALELFNQRIRPIAAAIEASRSDN